MKYKSEYIVQGETVAVKKIIEDLKEMGDPRAVKVWARVGLNASKCFGVNLTKLGKYSKKIGRDHDLAQELWATGYHDARLLAVLIEEPKRVSRMQIDTWIAQADFWDLTDKLVSQVVIKTPFAIDLISLWVGNKKEFIRRSGYMLLAAYAKQDKNLEEIDWENHLAVIEAKIQREENWVKEAMNYALMGIGGKRKDLNKKAVGVAKRVGLITVDYGESSCQTPNALAYLTSDRVKSKLQ